MLPMCIKSLVHDYLYTYNDERCFKEISYPILYNSAVDLLRRLLWWLFGVAHAASCGTPLRPITWC